MHLVASDLAWVGVLVATHFGLSQLFRGVYGDRRSANATMGGNTKQGEVTRASSLLREVLAYNTITVAYQLYCARVGTAAWFDGTAAAIGGSAQLRLYATSAVFEKLGRLTFCFEVYNTVAVVLLPEYRTAAFVGHHLVTGFLAYLSMQASGSFLHYYGLFFFGVAAVSSVPLAAVEVTKAAFPRCTEGLKVLFAVSFLAIRTVYWPIVSLGFWKDTLPGLMDGTARDSFAAAVFLVANVGLTGLQLFWTSLIVSGLAEMAQGKVAKNS